MGTVPMRISPTVLLQPPKELALLDGITGLDIQRGKAVEDALEARAVPRSRGVAIEAAEILRQQHTAAGRGNHRAFAVFGADDHIGRGPPAVAG